MNKVNKFSFQSFALMLLHDYYHCNNSPINVALYKQQCLDWSWSRCPSVFIKDTVFAFPTMIPPIYLLQHLPWIFNNIKHFMVPSPCAPVLLSTALTFYLPPLRSSCLHHRLGHKGFHDLQKWAAKGINGIPSDVATCPIEKSLPWLFRG